MSEQKKTVYDDVVECVAIALWRERSTKIAYSQEWSDIGPFYQDGFRDQAKAALDAVRVSLPGGTVLADYVEKRYPFSVFCCGAFSDGIVYVRNMLTPPKDES
jgi:hypothetical protein